MPYSELELDPTIEKKNDLRPTDSANKSSTRGEKRKRNCSKEMSSYEEEAVKILQQKAEQEMRFNDEMHKMRLKYEEEMFKVKLEILNIEKEKLLKNLESTVKI